MEKSALFSAAAHPLEGSLMEALGETAFGAYETLFERLRENHPGMVENWSYYRDTKCWLLKVSSKGKTLFWLGVYDGYFRTTFYLKPDAGDAVNAAPLPEAAKTQYAESKGKKYHGISLSIGATDDVDSFFALLPIKLAEMPSGSGTPKIARISYRKVRPADMDDIRGLIEEYMASMALDLCFQGIDEELKTLPGKYSEPDGALLVAKAGGALCGCVALRKIGDGICEMKRLFVRDAYKGRGVGKKLAQAIIEEGRAKGYRLMRLDTLESMKPALSLYRSLGFHETAAYVYNPLEGAVYLEKTL
ncbi:MAG TPA: GNAT family N-acetyltransferase [Rectinemataceae bacterium]|nr:GNAT family N-acetyltransferase [Rectinemataceae bacterium]